MPLKPSNTDGPQIAALKYLVSLEWQDDPSFVVRVHGLIEKAKREAMPLQRAIAGP